MASKDKKENSKVKCKHMYLEDYKLTIPKCHFCGHEKYARDGLGKVKGRDYGTETNYLYFKYTK